MPDECLVADSWYRKIAWSIVAGDQEGYEAHRIRSKLSLSHLIVAVNVHRALLRIVVVVAHCRGYQPDLLGRMLCSWY